MPGHPQINQLSIGIWHRGYGGSGQGFLPKNRGSVGGTGRVSFLGRSQHPSAGSRGGGRLGCSQATRAGAHRREHKIQVFVCGARPSQQTEPSLPCHKGWREPAGGSCPRGRRVPVPAEWSNGCALADGMREGHMGRIQLLFQATGLASSSPPSPRGSALQVHFQLRSCLHLGAGRSKNQLLSYRLWQPPAVFTRGRPACGTKAEPGSLPLRLVLSRVAPGGKSPPLMLGKEA